MNKFLVFLLIIWIGIALFRLPLYFLKANINLITYGGLSYSEKQELSYGKVYANYKKLDKILPEGEMGLYLKDNGWEFFLLRYLLYPKRIINKEHPRYLGSEDDYKYLILDEYSKKNYKNKTIIQLND